MASLQNQQETYYQDPVAQPYYAPPHPNPIGHHIDNRSPYYHVNGASPSFEPPQDHVPNGYYAQDALNGEQTNSTGVPPTSMGQQPTHTPGPVHIPQPPMDAPAEQPFYVNAKQYHRILKRRIARARLEETLKIARTRRPYLHESRHKHAMRRPRGQGGRFLTAAELAEKERLEKLKESEAGSEDGNLNNSDSGLISNTTESTSISRPDDSLDKAEDNVN